MDGKESSERILNLINGKKNNLVNQPSSIDEIDSSSEEKGSISNSSISSPKKQIKERML